MVHRLHIGIKKVGLAPGTPVYTGVHRDEPVRIDVIRYTADHVSENPDAAPEALPAPGHGAGVAWVNLVGLHDPDHVASVASRYGIHPLAVEDALSVGARPGISDYGDHIFATMKMLSVEADEVRSEHISIAAGTDWVLSFQERPGDVFAPVRTRIRDGRTRIRQRGADYLWFALLDAVVDQYLVVAHHITTRLESIEDRLWDEDTALDDVPDDVRALRESLQGVRRAVRPLRGELEQRLRHPPSLLRPDTLPYLRDALSHLAHVAEVLEHVHEAVGSVMEAYISRVSQRTNEVMKVLTIMASIFIPLTFIAGVYGMNFAHMPELQWPWAYPAVLLVMLAVAIAMVVFFRRRKWL